MKVIREPMEFHGELSRKILEAKENVILSALYLGCGLFESETLLATLERALIRNQRLRITIFLDYSRMLRERENIHLSSLLTSYSSRLSVCLYKMPSVTDFLYAQINEIFGVFHCKFAVFDNDFLLTGANLSEEYFKTRQDRYLLFESQNDCGVSSIADFLREFSLSLRDQCHLLQPKLQTISPANADRELFRVALIEMCQRYSSKQDSQSKVSIQPVIQHAPIGIRLEEQVISRLLAGHLGCNSTNEHPWHIELILASPYPSFTKIMRTALCCFFEKSKLSVTAIIPAPTAHGFNNGRGLKSVIPRMHEACYQDFLGYDSPFTIASLHYSRPLWTFHAKGIWLFSSRPIKALTREGNDSTLTIESNLHPDPKQNLLTKLERSAAQSTSSDCLEYEAITYIGSSNMGERSWKRDFELGFVLHVRDKSWYKQLEAECASLIDHCKPVNVHSVASMQLNSRLLRKDVPIAGKLSMRTASALMQRRIIQLLARVFRSFL